MTYVAVQADAGKRIDSLVAEKAELSRSAAQKLIEGGMITVSGKTVTKKYGAQAGDVIEITLPEPEEYDVLPEDIKLSIVYEDKDIIVINKPSGMVVHPAPGNYTGTLVNGLLHHCKDSLSGIGGVMRPGIVHRIDKDTSGLLVVAKNDAAHQGLAEQLEYHGVTREYRALVRGGFGEDAGTVDAPIGRHPVDRKKMAVLQKDNPTAKHAVTHYQVLERFGNISYLKLNLETGRTHQIRVHMSYKGHALLGDEVYATTKIPFEKQHAPLFSGQMLHARALSFIHPITKEHMNFECPLPDNFEDALRILREKES